MSGRLRVAVVGVGHLGQHHARVYSELPDAELVAVVDQSEERGKEVAERHGVEALTDPAQLVGRVDAVSVATPTDSHFAVASSLIAHGIHVLVEKPLCSSVEDARALCTLARDKGVVMQVGHIERFNPAVRAIKSRIKDPRFISCDRVSPFSFRSADIGVVLDLMIHDLDIVLHLCDAPLAHVEAMGVPVLVPSEDVAHARLRFETGAMALLTASRVSIKKERKIRIFQHDAYISIDYGRRIAQIYTKRPGFEFGQADLSAVDPTLPPDMLVALVFSQYLEMEEVSMEGEPLMLELESFVAAVREGREPEVTGEEGLRAMEVAAQIQTAMATHLDAERARLAKST